MGPSTVPDDSGGPIMDTLLNRESVENEPHVFSDMAKPRDANNHRTAASRTPSKSCN